MAESAILSIYVPGKQGAFVECSLALHVFFSGCQAHLVCVCVCVWFSKKSTFPVVADDQIAWRRRNTRCIFTGWATTSIARTNLASFNNLHKKIGLIRCR